VAAHTNSQSPGQREVDVQVAQHAGDPRQRGLHFGFAHEELVDFAE
jgi:hypothetical protein